MLVVPAAGMVCKIIAAYAVRRAAIEPVIGRLKGRARRSSRLILKA
jgi:hypothetical protein